MTRMETSAPGVSKAFSAVLLMTVKTLDRDHSHEEYSSAPRTRIAADHAAVRVRVTKKEVTFQ